MKEHALIRKPGESLEEWVCRTSAHGWGTAKFTYGVLVAQRRRAQASENAPNVTLQEVSPPPANFRFIDLFAGIGGFRIGMTLNGGECVFTCERDRFARETYKRWYGETDSAIHCDINDRKLVLKRHIPDHDVLCGGFPCQPFSLAGVSKKNSLGRAHGFDDEKQGNLFFRIWRILLAKRPPVVFLENVRNLESHNGGHTWKVIQRRLKRARYKVFYQVIDASRWVPQQRKRIFIVGFNTDLFGSNVNFKWPELPPLPGPTIDGILDPAPAQKYILNDHLWRYLRDYAKKHQAKGNGFGYGLVGRGGVARTLSARYHKDGAEILIDRGGDKNPRRLTPREALRLMGYDEVLAEKFGFAKRFGSKEDGFPFDQVSDTQVYRQCGNSVVPQVVAAIGKEIVRTMREAFVGVPDSGRDADRSVTLPRPPRAPVPVAT